jgi:hypothetical protein
MSIFLLICYLFSLVTSEESNKSIEYNFQPFCNIHDKKFGRETPKDLLLNKAEKEWLFPTEEEIQKYYSIGKQECESFLANTTQSHPLLVYDHIPFYKETRDNPLEGMKLCRGRGTVYDVTGMISWPFGPYRECPSYSKCWFGILTCGNMKKSKILRETRDVISDWLLREDAQLARSLPVPTELTWTIRSLLYHVRIVGTELISPELKYYPVLTNQDPNNPITEDIVIGQYAITIPDTNYQLEIRYFEFYPAMLYNWPATFQAKLSKEIFIENAGIMYLGSMEFRCAPIPHRTCDVPNICCGCEEATFIIENPYNIFVSNKIQNEICLKQNIFLQKKKSLPICTSKISPKPNADFKKKYNNFQNPPGRWIHSAAKVLSPNCIDDAKKFPSYDINDMTVLVDPSQVPKVPESKPPLTMAQQAAANHPTPLVHHTSAADSVNAHRSSVVSSPLQSQRTHGNPVYRNAAQNYPPPPPPSSLPPPSSASSLRSYRTGSALPPPPPPPPPVVKPYPVYPSTPITYGKSAAPPPQPPPPISRSIGNGVPAVRSSASANTYTQRYIDPPYHSTSRSAGYNPASSMYSNNPMTRNKYAYSSSTVNSHRIGRKLVNDSSSSNEREKEKENEDPSGFFHASGNPCLQSSEPEEFSSGHWFYAPYHCNYHFYSHDEVMQCFHFHDINHFHVQGDSVSRELYSVLLRYLGIPTYSDTELKAMTNAYGKYHLRFSLKEPFKSINENLTTTTGKYQELLVSEGYYWEWDLHRIQLMEQDPLPNAFITNHAMAHQVLFPYFSPPAFTQFIRANEYAYFLQRQQQEEKSPPGTAKPLPKFLMFQNGRELQGRRENYFYGNVFRMASQFLKEMYIDALGFMELDEFLLSMAKFENYTGWADGWHTMGTIRQMEVVVMINMVCNDWYVEEYLPSKNNQQKEKDSSPQYA